MGYRSTAEGRPDIIALGTNIVGVRYFIALTYGCSTGSAP